RDAPVDVLLVGCVEQLFERRGVCRARDQQRCEQRSHLPTSAASSARSREATATGTGTGTGFPVRYARMRAIAQSVNRLNVMLRWSSHEYATGTASRV